MSLYLVRAVCLALKVDEVVESLFALLDLVCKSLLAPFVHINDIAAETCNIAFHFLKCGCSLVIFKFCAKNNCSLVFVHSFINLLLVFRPPIFSIRSKDFLHVTGINLSKKEQEMQALFACFPALFILFSFLTSFHTGEKSCAGRNLVIRPVFQKYDLKLRRFS